MHLLTALTTHCIPCMTSKSAFTVFSHTTFIHFWQQQRRPWRALSARQKKKKKITKANARTVMQECLCETVIFVQYGRLICADVLIHETSCSVFLGYFSAGTSYKWRHNTKCRKKKPENMRLLLRIRCGPRARERVSVMAAVRRSQRQQQGKRRPQHSPHTEQMERRDTSDLLSCAPHFHHVISASCPIPQSVTGDGRSQPRKMPSSRRGPSATPAHPVTCFWWHEVSCPVCPSV